MQWPLTNLRKVTSILLNPLMFIFSIIVNEFMITKNSMVEIQNLVSKSWPIKSNSGRNQFWFNHFSNKIQRKKILKQNTKTILGDIFAKKWQCPPAFKMSKLLTRLFVKPRIVPFLSICKNRSINHLNSSNHLWDTPDLRVPRSIELHPFLTIPT